MAFFNSKKTVAETPIPEVMEEHTLPKPDSCGSKRHQTWLCRSIS